MTHRLAVPVILSTVALDAIGVGLIFPVMPDLILSVTGGTLAGAALWGGVLSTGFAVMQFLFGPALGALSDRWGRRPVLLGSLAVLAAGYVLMALAMTIWLLLVSRLVAGIASATHATATAFLADISAPEDRGRRFGLVGAAFGFGFVAGPAIGGLLAGVDTRAPFWGAALLAAINLAIAAVVLPETVTDRIRRPFSLARANPVGALAAVSRLPGLARLLTVFALLAVAMNVYPSIWPYFGTARFGWDAPMIGASLAVYGVCFGIAQATLVGPLIARFGEAGAATLGLCLGIATLTAFGFVAQGWLALALTVIAAVGGLTTPALQALASRATPEDAQGELQGVLASLNALAMIVAPLVMTAVFAAFTAPGAVAYLPGAPFLLAAGLAGLALALHLARPRPAMPDPLT